MEIIITQYAILVTVVVALGAIYHYRIKKNNEILYRVISKHLSAFKRNDHCCRDLIDQLDFYHQTHEKEEVIKSIKDACLDMLEKNKLSHDLLGSFDYRTGKFDLEELGRD